MKKKLQIALKITSPEWNKQTDRLTLNFINIDWFWFLLCQIQSNFLKNKLIA